MLTLAWYVLQHLATHGSGAGSTELTVACPICRTDYEIVAGGVTRGGGSHDAGHVHVPRRSFAAPRDEPSPAREGSGTPVGAGTTVRTAVRTTVRTCGAERAGAASSLVLVGNRLPRVRSVCALVWSAGCTKLCGQREQNGNHGVEPPNHPNDCSTLQRGAGARHRGAPLL